MTRNGRRSQSRIMQKRFGADLGFIRAIDGARDLCGQFVRRFASLIATSALSEMSEYEILPQKPERISQLLSAGLNIADFRSWPRNALRLDELHAFYEQHRSLSLRCFQEERHDQPSPQLPVMYEVDSWERVRSFCEANNLLHGTLVNEALPLATSRHCGNLIILDDKRYVMAFFEGNGTPRDVDTGAKKSTLKVLSRNFGERISNDPAAAFTAIADRGRSFMPERRPITLEFSIYPKPVGILKQNLVFWEWRGGSLHDLSQVIGHLVYSAPKCEMSFSLPAA